MTLIFSCEGEHAQGPSSHHNMEQATEIKEAGPGERPGRQLDTYCQHVLGGAGLRHPLQRPTDVNRVCSEEQLLPHLGVMWSTVK